MAERLIAAYVAHMRVRGFSEATIERRMWSLTHWVEAIDGRPAEEVTPDDVEMFLARWQHPATRHAFHSDLHCWYLWGMSRGHWLTDPTARTDSPKVGKRVPTPIPAPLVRRLVDETDERPVRTMIMLAAFAGLRVSEIAAVAGEDLDVGNRVVIVRKGKGDKGETVPMALELAEEVALVHRPGRLFRRRDGLPMVGDHVSDRIRRQLRALGIPGRPHDLRASFATESARLAGGDMRMVQGLLRHASVLTTERYCSYWPSGGAVVERLFAA